MESISPSELAVELLNHCLRGSQWPNDLLTALVGEALDEDERLAAPATRALFSIVVECLGDSFEPRLCDTYADLMSHVIAQAMPEMNAAALVQRYRAVREIRAVTKTPRNVFVLSRVTLGADIAVTSIVMDAARQRFPDAKLWFVGPKKAWELFQRSPGWKHVPIGYGRRGVLAERLGIFADLKAALARPDSIVLDPDSRLSQLGLLPICDEKCHFLFESRSFGGDSDASLPVLTQEWARATLGVEDAQPWLHPKLELDFGTQPVLTVSLGVGENPAKRVEDPFEEQLIKLLGTLGALVMVDAGAPGGEEGARVRKAISSSGLSEERVGIHEGSFASFAAMIAASSLYVGYDSAGQHVAAALGIPLVSVFAGFSSRRMLARWSPRSASPCTVIPVQGEDVEQVLAAVKAAL